MAILAHNITLSELMQQVVSMNEEGYRFITLTACDLGNDEIEIIYHFDKDLTLRNLRLIAPKDKKIPSISPIYFSAFWAENEAEDLFHLQFEGLKINYHSTMYYDGYDDNTALKLPFCRCSISTSLDGKTSSPSPTTQATKEGV